MSDQPQSGWYYALKGERFGPVSLSKLRALMRDGKLTPDDHVWNAEYGKDWVRLSEVEAVWDKTTPDIGDTSGKRPALKLTHPQQVTQIRKVPEWPGLEEKRIELARLPVKPADLDAAEKRLAGLKKLMPSVDEEAAKPPTRFSMRAFILVPLGGLLGIPLGALAGMVTWALGVLLTGLLVAVLVVIVDWSGKLLFVLPIVAVFLAFLTVLFRFTAVAVVSGRLVRLMSRVGRNPSRLFAGITALLAALAGAWVMLLCMQIFLPEYKFEFVNWVLERKPSGDSVVGKIAEMLLSLIEWRAGHAPGYWAVNGTGLAWAALVALGGGAGKRKAGRRQCPNCRRGLKRDVVASLDYQNALVLSMAVELGTFEDIVEILRKRGGGPCEVYVDRCDRCGSGNLEVELSYEWAGLGAQANQELKDVWRIGTRVLTKEEVDELTKTR